MLVHSTRPHPILDTEPRDPIQLSYIPIYILVLKQRVTTLLQLASNL